ncbi:aminoacyl-tRNA hydrolase [Chloroflexota bacterium]
MKLIVGLGNPGLCYTHNRHNIGFICLNHFARSQSIRFDRKEGKARIGNGEINGLPVVLARPQTGMNLSGESVSRLLRKYELNADNLIVIHDDLDLPTGKIRISRGSSAGGHRGANSIIDYLEGNQDFTRIRIGIGRPESAGTVRDKEDAVIRYVLSDFSAEEKRVINSVISEVSEVILCLLQDGLTAAMNEFN